MPKTIRNSFYKYLTYEKLMEAHLKSRKGKCYKKEIIEINLKQGMNIQIQGYINNKYEIILEDIEML